MTDISVGAPLPPEIDAATLPTPEAAADAPGAPEVEEVAPEVSEQMVRAALAAAGHLVSMPLANEHIPGHWRFSDEELDNAAPPLTRIVNRSPTLRAIAGYGDPMLLGLELVKFVTRNIDLQRRYDRDHPKPSLADRSKPQDPPAHAPGGHDVPERDGASPGGGGPDGRR